MTRTSRQHRPRSHARSSSSSSLSIEKRIRDRQCRSIAGPSALKNLSELREIPNAFVEFISKEEGATGQASKRRRVALDQYQNSGIPILEHIIICHPVIKIRCVRLKVKDTVLQLERKNIVPCIHRDSDGCAKLIEIVDDSGLSLFNLPLGSKEEMPDIHLALLVASQTRTWAKTYGRLWTDFDILLARLEDCDVVELKFTVKWNATPSPKYLSRATIKTNALLEVLNRYFPDPNFTHSTGKWSPHDFYTSAHTPDQDDKVAATLNVSNLKSSLYPFQKRTVQWMLQREGVEWCPDGRIRELAAMVDPSLTNSFIEAKDATGRKCFISHLFGLVTFDTGPFTASESIVKGGILAEEMGLGKTVEIIGLIGLHKRPKNHPDRVYDQFTGANVKTTSATLIVTPPSILQQWIAEIRRHAPSLKVMHYKGIKAYRDSKKILLSELVEKLANSDIVVSTYSVLAAEIHFTQLNPEKKLRRESKYPRPKSPLMMLSWWRCLIDEAQMIESGVSKAAIVARLIPRVNAWCVSGTPVRKDINDLLGLLVFLRHEIYTSIKHVWSALISSHKHDLQKLFGTLALRHSKRSVRDELKLPAQRRYVITVPFTPIEEQHYRELFKQMCDESGLDSYGLPAIDDWNPDQYSEVMRRWLIRLRQAALHPQVGCLNRKTLGHRNGPLRTVDQVLGAMMEQTDVAIRTDQRALFMLKLKRGQLFENSPKVKESLTIWTETADEVSLMVQECRKLLNQEVTTLQGDEKPTASKYHQNSSSEGQSCGEQDAVDSSSRLSTLRNRLRGVLEIQHMAKFFKANAYFQIKSNVEMTRPGSDEYRKLEQLEVEGYEDAKRLRREILQESRRKADHLMEQISKSTTTQNFVQIPELRSTSSKKGLESRRIMEQLDELASALDAQANILDEWRENTIALLLRPLVDEDEGLEITGDEYEDSTKIQDEVMIYVQALRAIVADRYDALSGQQNELIKIETKTALRLAKQSEGIFPEKTIILLGIRQNVKPKNIVSIRGVIAELRSIATSLRSEAVNENHRAQNELIIVEGQLKFTQKQLAEQVKVTLALEKEIELFTAVMNARLEYYRQLQQVSDMVSPYKGPNDQKTLSKLVADEHALVTRIAMAKSKRRYFDHLRAEITNPEELRLCVICRDTFEVGALTVCGHQYCKDCITLWWSTHRNCPVCKRVLIQAELHEIVYKPQQLSIVIDEIQSLSQAQASSSSDFPKSVIYSEISTKKLSEIKNIDLEGPSFTTKVDTLARHLIWLRESDPGAKSIIYSQFKEFLDMLARSFDKFRIGFSSFDKPNGIEKFMKDPGIECFLLHARAHSSGLNLINASHVFLCEPLLNTALELQAIARVDRIGQHQETTVWLYLVHGTVEESIYQLSVRRRMEHLDRQFSGTRSQIQQAEVEEELEEANSIELQQASFTGLLAKGGEGGEIVANGDLWECLFGGRDRKEVKMLETIGLLHEPVLGQHLRAEAAQTRQVA